MTTAEHAPMRLHLHRVPTKVQSVSGAGIRWCFICRAHTEFTKTVHVPIDLMSYYGPHITIECENEQHIDGDLFPGRERQWTDA